MEDLAQGKRPEKNGNQEEIKVQPSEVGTLERQEQSRTHANRCAITNFLPNKRFPEKLVLLVL